MSELQRLPSVNTSKPSTKGVRMGNICNRSPDMIKQADAQKLSVQGNGRFNMGANLLEAPQMDLAAEAGERE